jgi:hydrogenase nickel incorporation protein HypB
METPGTVLTIKLKSPVMLKNDEIAAENRARLEQLGLVGVNIMSSPGSGKTALLEIMAAHYGTAMAVIEGDVQTSRDAERVRNAGCLAHQIETRGSCHLDAKMVSEALDALPLDPAVHRLLIVENVGNLICPSSYDLGEHLRIGLLSVTEGDDKVLKYPALFSRINVLLISKSDLLPHLDFDTTRAIQECRDLNAHVDAFVLSSRTGEGMDAFYAHLDAAVARVRAGVSAGH